MKSLYSMKLARPNNYIKKIRSELENFDKQVKVHKVEKMHKQSLSDWHVYRVTYSMK